MDKLPISRAALGILFRLGGIVQRKLDVVEGAEFMVFENSDTVTIGSDGELDGLRSQVSQYRLELRMHPVLARAQIYGADGKVFGECLDLVERETVRAVRIAVAEGALKVALIREPKPERDAAAGFQRAGCVE